MFYRTYDTDNIKSIERDELDSYTPKTKSSPKDEKVKTTADLDKAAYTQEPDKDTDQETGELGREAWRLKRRLYEPDKEKRRTSPERIGIAGSKAAKKAKATRYVRDRKKLKELERQVGLAKELRKMDEVPEELPEEPEEIEPEDDYGPEYHLDDLGYESRTPRKALMEGVGYGYIPEIGYIWDNAESYINNHQPGHKLLAESKHRLLAVFDIVSKRFIVDSVLSHAEMLFDANWDYDHTVLFEIHNNELLVSYDCNKDDARLAINQFSKNEAGKLLFENNQKYKVNNCR
jgi:hypothetical protein